MESMEEIQSWVKKATILAGIIVVLCLMLVLSAPIMLVDIAVISVCAYHIWKHYSRAAATVQFIWQCLGLFLLFLFGGLTPIVFIIKSLIIYVFYKTMMATYAYHSITEVEAEFVD